MVIRTGAKRMGIEVRVAMHGHANVRGKGLMYFKEKMGAWCGVEREGMGAWRFRVRNGFSDVDINDDGFKWFWVHGVERENRVTGWKYENMGRLSSDMGMNGA